MRVTDHLELTWDGIGRERSTLLLNVFSKEYQRGSFILVKMWWGNSVNIFDLFEYSEQCNTVKCYIYCTCSSNFLGIAKLNLDLLSLRLLLCNKKISKGRGGIADGRWSRNSPRLIEIDICIIQLQFIPSVIKSKCEYLDFKEHFKNLKGGCFHWNPLSFKLLTNQCINYR